MYHKKFTLHDDNVNVLCTVHCLNVEFIWISHCCQYFPSPQSNRPMIQFHLGLRRKTQEVTNNVKITDIVIWSKRQPGCCEVTGGYCVKHTCSYHLQPTKSINCRTQYIRMDLEKTKMNYLPIEVTKVQMKCRIH